MTARQVREGRKVKLVDPVRVGVRFWDAEARGVRGAGGNLLPRELLDQPGVIFSHAVAKSRVLVAWEGGDRGMWLDADQVEPAK